MRATLLSLTFRWAVFLLALPLGAQLSSGDERYARLTPAEAPAVLAQFRASRLPADTCLKVTITHKPRRGEDSAPVHGLLWLGWSDAIRPTRSSPRRTPNLPNSGFPSRDSRHSRSKPSTSAPRSRLACC
jgi:hypothetical protein